MNGEPKEFRSKLRPQKKPEDVAKRVAEFVDKPPGGEGVVPLNPGFFQVQRMRTEHGAKRRAAKTTKLGG